MATPWSEVASSPAFKALPPDQQEAARGQYFNDVVAPQVPPEKLQDVRAQFDSSTRGSADNLVISGPSRSSMAEVAVNAMGKVLPGLADQVLNVPNQLLNLGKAGVGTAMTAMGRPPDVNGPLAIQPNPDFARRGAEAIGLVRPQVQPQGFAQQAVDTLTQGALGGALTGGATIPHMVVGAGMGALSAGAAGATEAATGNPALAAIAGMAVPAGLAGAPGALARVAPGLTAPALMQRALKPTFKQLENGNAARAIQTMLDEGINATPGGSMKLRAKIGALNEEIAQQIKDSPAILNKDEVYGPLKATLNKFSMQVAPNADMATIRKTWDEFKDHPSFAPMNAREAELIGNVAQKQESMISALQDAGRFKTMAAQQQNLARGGQVRLSPKQTPNEPYMGVGVTGGRAISPSAYPPSGPGTNVRFPERYTENTQRVPEATSANADAMAIFQQRRQELDQAVSELDKFKKAGGAGIPIQLAQKLKQGTYRILDKKYGQVSSADDEAQKAIARGLKEQIAAAAPEVHGLNTAESALLNARKIVDRRALMAGNHNIGGLAPMSTNLKGALAFLLDRNPTAISLLSRGVHSMDGLGAVLQHGAKVSPIVTNGILAELQRQSAPRPDVVQVWPPRDGPIAYAPEARAGGGPVTAGKPYLVGEIQPERYVDDQGRRQMVGVNGPQVFVPQQNGTVIPNGDQWRANPARPDNWRYDDETGKKTGLKGPGWLGALLTPDNKVMTENSIGVNMNGKETQIPSLVPGLTPQEVTSIMNGQMPQSAVIKAADFARQNISQGLSVFAPAAGATPHGPGLAGLLEQLRAQGPAWAKTENAMDSAQVQRTLRRQ